MAEVVEALQQMEFVALLPLSSLCSGNIMAFCIPCGDCVLSYLAWFFQIIIKSSLKLNHRSELSTCCQSSL